MKKQLILWFISSVIIMLLFPFLAATFVKGDGGNILHLLRYSIPFSRSFYHADFHAY